MTSQASMTRSMASEIEARVPEAPREIRPCREQLADVVAMIAREFRPERIVLFGSHAYGTPTSDSDVDLMVIMDTPARPVDQAAAIRERLELEPSFPLDLLVRTPERIALGLTEGDFFIEDVMLKGKTLYEAGDAGLDRQSRG